MAGIPGDRSTYYFGAAAGGVWKTADGGTNWDPIFDEQKTAAIGAIAVSPSNSNIVYVGTGDTKLRGNVSRGNGVYKSLDAGRTWNHVGLERSYNIGRLIVDPRDPDVVFVAALGSAFGPNPERGIFRSRDGGETWERVLFVDAETGGIDVSMDPTNPALIMASLWQVIRKPYDLVSGGPGSGLYRSADGGDSWERLSGHGLPNGTLGKIGVAISP
ncbi:MAG: WD40/YVTN/BNR-like repeat-containing protein, partial [Vicinamibacteria bacterium]